MRRFLIVGCGGSGGRTVRLLIDQLRADLRARGITSLPDAWQFVHIDVPVDPDKGPAPLGSIRDLGGQYVSFSSPTNTYLATANAVEAQLGSKGNNFAPLMGWAPRDRETANGIPVNNGAGQYRAVGRMLTLPRLTTLHETLVASQARAVAPNAWGDIPRKEQTSNVIIPIVVGSMAGGSGASMFLDVCRVLGSLPGVKPQNIGCFMFTADVFAELTAGQRANVEGNAMGAMPEILGAITRLSEPFDRETYQRLGVPFTSGNPPFGRVFPIGRRIGGDGAFFGDGSSDGVYRGIARALAGTMMSEAATSQYVDFMLGNPQWLDSTTNRFGWRADRRALPFGSLGFASLSLGRDRYLDYAAQRLSRTASDHLVEGHLNPTSQLPGNDQLRMLMDNQIGSSLVAIGLPQLGQPVPDWFQSVAFPRPHWEAAARDAAAPGVAMMGNSGSAPAAQWVSTVASSVGALREQARYQLQHAAYAWGEQWAYQLEEAVKAEFLRVVAGFGLPYGRELMTRVRMLADQIIGQLAEAGRTADAADPVALDSGVGQQAQLLGKKPVDFTHPLGQLAARSLQGAMENVLRREGARVGAGVLRAFATDVLGGLEKAANDSLHTLEVERARDSGGAGLAQLNSAVYADWPDETERVPQRFNHAENEVLLTTADDFPAQFRSDVVSSAGGFADYRQGLGKLRAEAIAGRWETTGSKVAQDVLQQVSHWRPSVLPNRAADGTPTPEAKPSYSLRLDSVDLLGRATLRLAAVGDVFANFAGASISDYLDDPAVTPIDRQLRHDGFAAKLIETMDKARPVVGVDIDMAKRLHGVDVRFVYSFSEIPLEATHPVADQVVSQLGGKPELESTSIDNFKTALSGALSTAGKVNVFGSYQKVSPMCFTSLLEPINARWAASPITAQRDLWQWKRTRPLYAALGMSTEEAKTIIAGWYLGRLVGLVRQDAYGTAEVRTPRGWVRFGDLLTSEETAIRTPHDVLAGVLMSHTRAFVACVGDPDLTPLAPYEGLRLLIDGADSNEQSKPDQSLNGTTLLHAAFYDQPFTLGGVTLEGDGLSQVLTSVPAGATPADTAAARVEATCNWIDGLKGMLAAEWGGDEATVRALQLRLDVDGMRRMSLFSELAPLALPALDRLKQLAQAAGVDDQGVKHDVVWV
ncbi:Tubulin like [Tessaracoccus bendigoensis DSM 12906]|uniref:Tubulin like n=1 Tax=Tessaracoccus bendigoensis DSM 12906 TaxID=1123357 RepID=A0A1M6EQD2_9ACTN|nr:tubulin-like doman-containing protein [Tessaracoccus bendigoensis]SHI87588.1 Tubulin like [Tessaracoccus bendigoensis DSM 12906]